MGATEDLKETALLFAVCTREIGVRWAVGLYRLVVGPEGVEDGSKFGVVIIVSGDIALDDANDVGVQTSEISDGHTFLDGTLKFPVDVLQYELEVVMVDDGIAMSGDRGLSGWYGG